MNKPRTNNRNSKYSSKEGSHSRTGGMDRKNFKNDRFPRKEGERLERTHRTASTSSKSPRTSRYGCNDADTSTTT